MSSDSIPTLMDPPTLFLRLILYAGVPAAVVVVMTALLGSYQALVAWIGIFGSARRMGTSAGGRVRDWTSERTRALITLGFFSIVTVCFSYILAVIGYAAVLMLKAAPQHVFSPGQLADQVRVSLWPPIAFWIVVGEIACVCLLGVASIGDAVGLQKLARFAGGLVWIAAWGITFWLGTSAVCMCLGLLLQIGQPPSPNAVPVPLLWDAGITAAIAFVVVLSVPKVSRASKRAFGRPSPSWRP